MDKLLVTIHGLDTIVIWTIGSYGIVGESQVIALHGFFSIKRKKEMLINLQEILTLLRWKNDCVSQKRLRITIFYDHQKNSLFVCWFVKLCPHKTALETCE